MLPNAQSQRFDYAIIGAGCFGVSTALALCKRNPESRIIVFDSHSKVKVASKDETKIVRTPYADDEYVLLAKAAKHEWGLFPYSAFYHPTSWI